MTKVTFQVLEGVDKGRIFRELATPVTIGREEGNLLRLNDERVSRFHAKVQFDDGDVILTDLESTNGTRVNGNVVQIRRLRHGDRVAIGRSLLLFGSNQEIAARVSQESSRGQATDGPAPAAQGPATVHAQTALDHGENEFDFDLNLGKERTAVTNDALFIGTRALPPLPLKMTPAQAARFAEILDFLHQGLVQATENIEAREDGTQVTLSYADWQRVLAVQMLLSRYLRAVAEPDSLND
jgi:pSer/pThr/pTyr-binding forkhead associated (FHA) protein